MGNEVTHDVENSQLQDLHLPEEEEPLAETPRFFVGVTLDTPKTLLGTQPISYTDNQSPHHIYRYPLPTLHGSSFPDITRAVPRENVLDFFYPHTLDSGGGPKLAESIDRLKMRRDVFLLAYSAVQALGPDDRWSYYQIAGIHGLPHAPYDGDQGEWDAFNNEWWGGYCQHGTPLFPTWHRPYMMLMEQSIIRQAKLLASTLGDPEEKDAVMAMADGLRLPYLDWASNCIRILGLPDIFTTTEIALAYAWKSFSRASIPNPLKAFVTPRDIGKPFASSDVFNPSARPNYAVPPQGFPYLPAGYPAVRHVTPGYLSNHDEVNATLMRNAGTALIEGVHAMFQHKKWLPFSNHFWSEETHGDGEAFGHYSSLEVVHDYVHGVFGGAGGHMTYPELAAFDPIFFFHHSNIDRLTALWQYINPGEWIPDPALQLNHDGTFTLYPDTQSVASTELTPFRLAPDEKPRKFVTSDDVRLVDFDCGYSYPEIVRARKEGWTPGQMKEHVLKLYKPPQDFVNKWVLVVDRIEKRAFNGPFQIRVFVGKADANADTSIKCPNFAGEMTVFARSTGVRCANCDQRKYMRASLDLTKTMVRLGITTTELISASEDPFAGDIGAPLTVNPFSAPNSIKPVFVSLTGHELDTSGVSGDDGIMLSLYYQRGVSQDSLSEVLVQKYTLPTVAKP